jgi:serine/threonine protein phosphatase PrpC
MVIEQCAKGASPARALQHAHESILRTTAEQHARPMGATAVVFSIMDTLGIGRFDWAGDSRAYLWRDGVLRRLTRDHTFVQELVDVGAISDEEALQHPNRNVVTRAIGVGSLPQVHIDTVSEQLISGDRLLICTDGLHGYLGEARIAECLAEAPDAEGAARQLVARTLAETEAGDNVTAVCVYVD